MKLQFSLFDHSLSLIIYSVTGFVVAWITFSAFRFMFTVRKVTRLIDQGKYAEAATLYRWIQRRSTRMWGKAAKTNRFVAEHGLAISSRMQGEMQNAISHLEKCRELLGQNVKMPAIVSVQVECELAIASQAMGNEQLAEEACNRAESLVRTANRKDLPSVIAQFVAGASGAAAVNQVGLAKRILESAIKFMVDNEEAIHPHMLANAKVDYGAILSIDKEFVQAKNMIESVLDSDPEEFLDWSIRSKALLTLGECLMVIGELDESIQVLEGLVERHREEGEPLGLSIAMETLAQSLTQYGSYDEAIQLRDEALVLKKEITSDSFQIHATEVMKARVHILLGEFEIAHELLSSLERFPQSRMIHEGQVLPVVMLFRGLFFDELLEHRMAAKKFRETLSTGTIVYGEGHSALGDVYLCLSGALVEQNEISEARRYFKLGERIRSNGPVGFLAEAELNLLRSELARESGQPELGLEHANSILQSLKGKVNSTHAMLPTAHHLAATALLDLQRPHEAIVHVDEAIRIRNSFQRHETQRLADSYGLKSKVLASLGREQEAVDFKEKVNEIRQDWKSKLDGWLHEEEADSSEPNPYATPSNL